MAQEFDPYNIKTDPDSLRQAILNLRLDFDSHNHDGTSSRMFETVRVEAISARVFSIKKSSYTDNTEGLWVGLSGTVTKMFLGSAQGYIKWTGSSLDILGTVSSLNIYAATAFETAARFGTAVTGSGAVTFGNSGVTLTTGSTSGSSAKVQWAAGLRILSGSPVFSATVDFTDPDISQGAGTIFIGIGTPTVSGTGHTFTEQHAGFKITKTAGTATLRGTQADGTTEATTSGQTLSFDDDLDLVMKINGTTSIDYYYRLNGGALTLLGTISTNLPTSAMTTIQFSAANNSTAFIHSFTCMNTSYSR